MLAKTIGISNGIVDGAKAADDIKFKSFSTANFRENLGRITGKIPDGMDAHHMLPKKHKAYFDKAQININDPQYGCGLISISIDRKLMSIIKNGINSLIRIKGTALKKK